jgi:anti-sigma regulatory factor (Ser/Thr protein kinase)
VGSAEVVEVPSGFTASVRGFGELRDLRDQLAAWLTILGVEEPTGAELVLAVNEVATNGIEASPSGDVEVDAVHLDGLLRVAVVNQGLPFDGVAPPVDPASARGRGLRLAAALSDSLAFTPTERGTEVTLVKRLR